MIEGSDAWRHENVGRLLNNSVLRFESRVFQILECAGHGEVRISLLSLTRNLDLQGTSITELGRRAGMTKQAMSELVGQGEILGLVVRVGDHADRRSKKILFTAKGQAWLAAFREALAQAENEMATLLGKRSFASLTKALLAYGEGYDTLSNPRGLRR